MAKKHPRKAETYRTARRNRDRVNGGLSRKPSPRPAPPANRVYATDAKARERTAARYAAQV